MASALSRRGFFLASSVLAGARAANYRSIRLGGPIFLKSDDPKQLAKEHRRVGYSAAYCPPAEVSDAERIRAIRDAFAAEDVVISEVGAWKNMLDPDSQKRADNLRYVTDRLALAEAVGARCCVDIAGSFNPGNLGTYEGGNILIARMFALPTSTGLAVAVARRARAIFWTAAGVICLILLSRQKARNSGVL